MSSAEQLEQMALAMAEYQTREPMLTAIAHDLTRLTSDLLAGIPHVDRVAFRAKTARSYASKSLKHDNGVRKYDCPSSSIEDQVAGRVLVFFKSDIDVVVGKLKSKFNPVEQIRKQPISTDAFSYESEHLVFTIPPTVWPNGWSAIDEKPASFEMQVRTLFMHAWAEPTHDLVYKADVELTDEEKRIIAWCASHAWGGDAIYEQLLQGIRRRAPR